MKNKRSILLIALISLTVFSVSANLVNAKVQNNVIKIGSLAPMAIVPGIDTNHAAELAIEEINAAGGVNIGGTMYTLELVKETTSGTLGLPDASTAALGYSKLAYQEEVVAIIGGFRTEVMQTVQLGGHLDRPFLGVGSTVPLISPYFWRVMPGNGTGLTRAMISLYNFNSLFI